MTEAGALVALEEVSLSVRGRDGAPVPILRDVSLELHPGEIVGLVGESGSGKSMTARVVAGLLPAGAEQRGEVRLLGTAMAGASEDRWRKVRGDGVAMVFQDPRAHIDPVRSIGDFLIEALVQLRGVGRPDALRRASRMLAEVGVSHPDQRLAQYPHELSGGLLQRVMIASTLLMEPRVLLADEPTTALDVTTQSELLAIIQEQQQARDMAVLFITHDLDLAAAIADRVAVMYAGEVVECGTAELLDTRPRHPYTAALLASNPGHASLRRPLQVIEGAPVSAADVGAGCAFAPRCRYAFEACARVRPPLSSSGTALSRCLLDADSGLVSLL